MLKCITMHINIVSTMALWPCPGPGVQVSCLVHCPLIAVTLTRILHLRTTQTQTHTDPVWSCPTYPTCSVYPAPQSTGGNGHNAVVEILQAEELQRQTMELRIGLHDHWMRLVERCQICIIQVFAEAEEKVVTRYKSPGCSGVRASCWETWQ